MTRRRMSNECQCLGCGCDAAHPCADLLGDPCRWLIRSATGRLGICSQCPGHLVTNFKAGIRKFTPRAEAAIAARRMVRKIATTNN